jgi:hypothetical protein
MYVDGSFFLNDDGIHGMVERCDRKYFQPGLHVIYVTGFQAGGGVGMEIRYSGPDTQNNMIFMRVGVDPTAVSSSGKYFEKCNPNSPMTDDSKFSICIFRSEVFLSSFPALRDADTGSNRLYFAGKGKIPVMDMHDLLAFRSYVPATPDINYAWAIYGQLKVSKQGSYEFCISSDDG